MSKKEEQVVEEGFGWSDKVDVPESSFTLLPEGPAFFTITKLERKRKEFGKFGVCNVAVMTFLCVPVEGDNQSGEIQGQFALVRALGWKIVQLATACGFRKHGDSSEIDPRWWGQFVGAEGGCILAHRKFTGKKDGKEKLANEIAEFTDPEETGAKPQDKLTF